MKTHLFLAYSNLHLMFAQAIALNLPKGERKVLWLGTQSAGSPLLKLYEIMILNDLWNEIVPVDFNQRIQPISFGRMLRRAISDIREGRAAVKAIRGKITKLNESVEAWIPHQYDWSCRIVADKVARRKGAVHFFEEGLSIYLDRNNKRKFPLKAAFSQIMKAYGAGCALAVRKPLEHSLTDVYQICVNKDTVFPRHIPRHSLANLCGKSYTDRLLSIPSFRTAAERLVSSYPRSEFVLFINSVDVEDNYISRDDYLESVRRGVKASGFENETIIVKPHPRNRTENVNALVRVLGNRAQLVNEDIPLPIEIIAPLLNLKAVVGTNSSALVYLKLVHGIDTISISGIMSGEGPMFHRNMNFATAFGDIVHCVS